MTDCSDGKDVVNLLREYRDLKSQYDALDTTPIPYPAICAEYLTRGRPLPGDTPEPVGKDSEFVKLGYLVAEDRWSEDTIEKVSQHVCEASVRYREESELLNQVVDKKSQLQNQIQSLAVQIADAMLAVEPN